MQKIEDPKVLFQKMLNYLSQKKSLKTKPISNHTGLSYSKLRNINTGRSSANAEMVETLIKYYPELIEEFGLEVKEKEDESELEERVKQLENDNRLLKEMMIKMLNEHGDTEKAEIIKKLI